MFGFQDSDKGIEEPSAQNSFAPAWGSLTFPLALGYPQEERKLLQLHDWLATRQPGWFPLRLGLLSQTTHCGLLTVFIQDRREGQMLVVGMVSEDNTSYC